MRYFYIFMRFSFLTTYAIYYHINPLRVRNNSFKDISEGLIVRFDWIESDNWQLSLGDTKGSQVLVNHSNYNTTQVCANISIEPPYRAGNSIAANYSEVIADYQKSILYFYNNTVISTQIENTTLIKMSTN